MLIRDRRIGAVLGVGFLVLGYVCIHDAYARRNVKMPLFLRPFYPWNG